MPETAVIPLALNGRNAWSLMTPEIPVAQHNQAALPESIENAWLRSCDVTALVRQE
jgi:hypothetical protein